jgi:hypothetical protein
MPRAPEEREAPITDARGLVRDELTDREGRKVRDLDRVGAMTPDTDSENGAKTHELDLPDLVDDDDEARPDDQPR